MTTPSKPQPDPTREEQLDVLRELIKQHGKTEVRERLAYQIAVYMREVNDSVDDYRDLLLGIEIVKPLPHSATGLLHALYGHVGEAESVDSFLDDLVKSFD